MADHVKPTVEELEKESKELLSSIEETPTETDEEEKKEELEEKAEKVEDVEKGEDKKKEEEPAEDEEPEPSEALGEEEKTYKKKFSESTKEALILHAKNAKFNKAVEEAAKIAEPTEEEMAAAYADWSLMSDVEKNLAKTNVKNEKRFSMLADITKESKDVDAWNAKVEAYVADPKVLADKPQLEGRVEDFKLFCLKPTRRGVDFDDLVSSFLYNESQTRKIHKNKGAMFEKGSSGQSKEDATKSGKVSLERAEQIRKQSWKRYRELLDADLIDDGI